jgi:glutamate dehydrogenase/leucine dehydrogenase
MATETAVGGGYDSYQRYFDHEANPPLLVLEWRDKESDAEGFLAIYSLRGGAAGGGTRMARYKSSEDARNEAISLAKTMEIKFKVAGPAIGGAKSVLNFDPASPAKQDVLRRWYRAIRPMMKMCYGTGGDANVSDEDVIDLISELDEEWRSNPSNQDPKGVDAELGDPQGGIVRGHFPDATDTRIANLRKGVPMVVPGRSIAGRPLEVLDLVTGFGVACAARKAISCRGDRVQGTRVLIEGFGNVGEAAALFLHEWGADVVGILSLAPNSGANGAKRLVVATGSGDKLDVPALLERRENMTLSALDSTAIADESEFFSIPAGVFIPAAVSHTISENRLQMMKAAGVHTIVPGANVPFAKTNNDNGQHLSAVADQDFAIVPDFIANCGMARAFAFFMEQAEAISDDGHVWDHLADDVTRTIEQAVEKVWTGGEGKGMLAKAYVEYLEA